MKKIVVLSVFALAAIGSIVACDDGSNVVECTGAADCADGEGCDLSSDPGVCVPADCAEDNDCVIADTGEGSPISESDGGCGDGEVAFDSFDGTELCGLEEETAGDCAAGGFDTAEVGDTTICVKADSEAACGEGVCSF